MTCRRRFLIQGLGGAALSSLPFDTAWANTRTSAPKTVPLTLVSLLDRFKRSPGMSANFVEKKQIALLKNPIVNSGRVYFQAPSLFARHIDSPFPSSVLVEKHKVTLFDGSKRRVLPLEKHPALAQLTTTFLSLLSGDLAALRRTYELRFTTAQVWKLELTPRTPELKRLLTQLTAHGKDASLTRMTLTEASGDRSETEFTQMASERTFTQAEVSQYFSVKRS